MLRFCQQPIILSNVLLALSGALAPLGTCHGMSWLYRYDASVIVKDGVPCFYGQKSDTPGESVGDLIIDLTVRRPEQSDLDLWGQYALKVRLPTSPATCVKYGLGPLKVPIQPIPYDKHLFVLLQVGETYGRHFCLHHNEDGSIQVNDTSSWSANGCSSRRLANPDDPWWTRWFGVR